MFKITPDLLEREHEVREYIERYAKTFDIDPNLARGLISQESAFVAEAVSPTGAFGYGQFTVIGAKQVVEVAKMNPAASDLINFSKRDASNPDRGIKAVYAFLWWLLKVKYAKITDKKIQLEAALTFYNAGGRPAAVIIKHGGHHLAIEALKQLPKSVCGQAIQYAPGVAEKFVAWHEHMEEDRVLVAETTKPAGNPMDDVTQMVNVNHRALIEALLLLTREGSSVESTLDVRDGMTELTLIFPGEFE